MALGQIFGTPINILQQYGGNNSQLIIVDELVKLGPLPAVPLILKGPVHILSHPHPGVLVLQCPHLLHCLNRQLRQSNLWKFKLRNPGYSSSQSWGYQGSKKGSQKSREKHCDGYSTKQTGRQDILSVLLPQSLDGVPCIIVISTGRGVGGVVPRIIKGGLGRECR